MWDMKLQSDEEITFSRPDVAVMAKEKKSCLLIDVACPFDTRLIEKRMKRSRNTRTSEGKSDECGTVKTYK